MLRPTKHFPMGLSPYVSKSSGVSGLLSMLLAVPMTWVSSSRERANHTFWVMLWRIKLDSVQRAVSTVLCIQWPREWAAPIIVATMSSQSSFLQHASEQTIKTTTLQPKEVGLNVSTRSWGTESWWLPDQNPARRYQRHTTDAYS